MHLISSLSRSFTRLLAGVLLLALAAGCASNSNGSNGASSTSASQDPAQTTAASPSQDPAETASASPSPESVQAFLSIQDDAGREVTLQSKPQRIVVLSPQLLDLLYEVNGSAIARTSTSGAEAPEGAKNLEDVGGMTTVNTEKLLALKPDLVLGSPTFHRNLADVLDASHIPFALFSLSNYTDLRKTAPIFGKLAGTEDAANAKLADLDRKIGELTGKLPADAAPTFVMLNVTPSSISVQRTNTVGIEVAGMLHMKNVAESLNASEKSPSTAPYSLEKLVELDPDYVFILIHGAKDDGEKKIQSDLSSQPAWASLRAVKEGRMAILPSDLLLSNPGFRLDESVDYLAKLVYPDIYGDGK